MVSVLKNCFQQKLIEKEWLNDNIAKRRVKIQQQQLMMRSSGSKHASVDEYPGGEDALAEEHERAQHQANLDNLQKYARLKSVDFDDEFPPLPDELDLREGKGYISHTKIMETTSYSFPDISPFRETKQSWEGDNDQDFPLPPPELLYQSQQEAGNDSFSGTGHSFPLPPDEIPDAPPINSSGPIPPPPQPPKPPSPPPPPVFNMIPSGESAAKTVRSISKLKNKVSTILG